MSMPVLWAHRAIHLVPDSSSIEPIVLRIELLQEACSKQEVEARSAAYAMQER
jgi:hypothetical protein